MGIAVTLAQYLLEQGAEYDLVPHPHTDTALASATASGLPADRVVKAVVVKGSDGFKVALLPASRHIKFDDLRHVLGTDVESPTRSRSKRCSSIASPARSPRWALHTAWTLSWMTAWPGSQTSILRGATTPIWSASPERIFRS
jgi:Ala-tRNA(Pro) deacylase